MTAKLQAVLYARYSPRPEPKSDGRPLSDRDERRKRKAAEDRLMNSCDKQVAYGKEYCARMGYELRPEHIFRDDALSGGSDKKRIGLRGAKAACKRGMILVARDIKRVSRNMLDTFALVTELAKRGVIFETIADGRYDAHDVNKIMVFGIKAVMAHCERITIGRDTKEKMRRHQANGRRMSGIAPFGFRPDPDDESRWLPDDAEQAVVQRIRELRSEGLGLRAVGRQLEAEGMLCRGFKWQHKTIQRILARAMPSEARNERPA